MSASEKSVPLSLKRKSSARVAAVQCLYRLKITEEETTPEKLAADYLVQWQDDKHSHDRVLSRDAEPDKGLLNKLLIGAMQKQGATAELIAASLNDKWTMERMSPLLISVLECAISELQDSPTRSPAIIINEYVTLAGRFFEPPEVGFVNGLLDALAKKPVTGT